MKCLFRSTSYLIQNRLQCFHFGFNTNRNIAPNYLHWVEPRNKQVQFMIKTDLKAKWGSILSWNVKKNKMSWSDSGVINVTESQHKQQRKHVSILQKNDCQRHRMDEKPTSTTLTQLNQFNEFMSVTEGDGNLSKPAKTHKDTQKHTKTHKPRQGEKPRWWLFTDEQTESVRKEMNTRPKDETTNRNNQSQTRGRRPLSGPGPSETRSGPAETGSGPDSS